VLAEESERRVNLEVLLAGAERGTSSQAKAVYRIQNDAAAAMRRPKRVRAESG